MQPRPDGLAFCFRAPASYPPWWRDAPLGAQPRAQSDTCHAFGPPSHSQVQFWFQNRRQRERRQRRNGVLEDGKDAAEAFGPAAGAARAYGGGGGVFPAPQVPQAAVHLPPMLQQGSAMDLLRAYAQCWTHPAHPAPVLQMFGPPPGHGQPPVEAPPAMMPSPPPMLPPGMMPHLGMPQPGVPPAGVPHQMPVTMGMPMPMLGAAPPPIPQVPWQVPGGGQFGLGEGRLGMAMPPGHHVESLPAPGFPPPWPTDPLPLASFSASEAGHQRTEGTASPAASRTASPAASSEQTALSANEEEDPSAASSGKETASRMVGVADADAAHEGGLLDVPPLQAEASIQAYDVE